VDEQESRKRHDDVLLAGFRARASAVGLLQLVVELRRAGAIDADAVGRIRDAMAAELALDRSTARPDQEAQDSVLRHLDQLLAETG